MTLIETMVWIAVFTLTMIALTQSLLYFYRTNRITFQEEEAISSAQHAMNIVVQALRTASYSNNGAYPVISISPNQVSFYANVTKNDPLIQQVRFFVQGTSLIEGIIEPAGNPLTYSPASEVTKTLSTYVQNLTFATTTFSYYDQNGNPITDYSQFDAMRFVTINLIVDVSTTSLPTSLDLMSSAALRNL